MQLSIMQLVRRRECVLVVRFLLLAHIQHVTFAMPAYNAAERLIQGGSPVEDHSEHLADVAVAYKQTDSIYNNYPNADIQQPIPAVQVGKVMEYAEREVEHPDSAVQTFYENKHKAVNNKAARIPVVDRIQDHEKFGNSGDQFLPLTRGIVNGVEAIANLINHSITGTEGFFSRSTKLVTEQLDQLGAKIVGL